MDEYKSRFAQDTAQAHARRNPRRRRHLPRTIGRRPAQTRDARRPWPTGRSSWRWPIPNPKSCPELAKKARPDALICTGRSDYPNQVNNVLCFPFIFRGALDVGATGITEAMKVAAVNAIAGLAQAEASDVVAKAYGAEQKSFGPEYLIPTPFDPRLIERIAPAVAKAAMESRSCNATDRGSRGLPRKPRTLRLQVRSGHEGGVRYRPAQPEARDLRRGRRRAYAARCPDDR